MILVESQELCQQLSSAQNRDGGWSYQRGQSWTEPTALALLVHRSYGAEPEAFHAGVRWLATQQRPDGGWAPNPGVDMSTSVTSLALLALLSANQHASVIDHAIGWAAAHVYSDHLSLGLVLAHVLGLPPAQAPGSVPWFPGSAGWVIPTSMTIIALSQAARARNQPGLLTLVRSSQAYLLGRRCVDGGWNHGGSNTRSEDATSYPETTGLALLALSSLPKAELSTPLKFCSQLLRSPQSSEGLSWLQMGLTANGMSAADPAILPRPYTTRDIALRLLALAARTSPLHPLSPLAQPC